MADFTLPDLNAGGAISDTDLLESYQGAAPSVRITALALATYSLGKLTGAEVIAALGFTPGAGTVTTVSSTTGEISIANPTTTPALTIHSAPKWTTARNLSFTGDATGTNAVDGSADVATALTLAASGVTAGSYTYASITVDAKGRVTAASSGAAPTGTVTTTGSPANGNLTKFTGATSISNGDLSGDVSTAGSLVTTLATVNANVGSFGDGTHVGAFTVNAKGLITAASAVAITSAPKWATARTLSFTGDVTGSGSVDGSADVATALTLANSGVTAATYFGEVTVDAKGRVTAASQAVPVSSTASSATPTPDATKGQFEVTALAAGATFAAPSGSPIDAQKLIIRIKDNGSAQTLAWNAIYRAVGVTLPSTTVAGKTLYLGMIYNGADSTWDVIALAQQA